MINILFGIMLILVPIFMTLLFIKGPNIVISQIIYNFNWARFFPMRLWKLQIIPSAILDEKLKLERVRITSIELFSNPANQYSLGIFQSSRIPEEISKITCAYTVTGGLENNTIIGIVTGSVDNSDSSGKIDILRDVAYSQTGDLLAEAASNLDLEKGVQVEVIGENKWDNQTILNQDGDCQTDKKNQPIDAGQARGDVLFNGEVLDIQQLQLRAYYPQLDECQTKQQLQCIEKNAQSHESQNRINQQAQLNGNQSLILQPLQYEEEDEGLGSIPSTPEEKSEEFNTNIVLLNEELVVGRREELENQIDAEQTEGDALFNGEGLDTPQTAECQTKQEFHRIDENVQYHKSPNWIKQQAQLSGNQLLMLQPLQYEEEEDEGLGSIPSTPKEKSEEFNTNIISLNEELVVGRREELENQNLKPEKYPIIEELKFIIKKFKNIFKNKIKFIDEEFIKINKFYDNDKTEYDKIYIENKKKIERLESDFEKNKHDIEDKLKENNKLEETLKSDVKEIDDFLNRYNFITVNDTWMIIKNGLNKIIETINDWRKNKNIHNMNPEKKQLSYIALTDNKKISNDWLTERDHLKKNELIRAKNYSSFLFYEGLSKNYLIKEEFYPEIKKIVNNMFTIEEEQYINEVLSENNKNIIINNELNNTKNYELIKNDAIKINYLISCIHHQNNDIELENKIKEKLTNGQTELHSYLQEVSSTFLLSE